MGLALVMPLQVFKPSLTCDVTRTADDGIFFRKTITPYIFFRKTITPCPFGLGLSCSLHPKSTM